MKCMMRADTLNWHDYGGLTEMTALPSNVYSTYEDKSKRIIVQKNFIAELFREQGLIKKNIFNETLSQNYSVDVEKLCSTEIDKSEYAVLEQKDEGSEVTYDVTNFNASNIFEYGGNNPDVSYERAYMDAPGN